MHLAALHTGQGALRMGRTARTRLAARAVHVCYLRRTAFSPYAALSGILANDRARSRLPGPLSRACASHPSLDRTRSAICPVKNGSPSDDEFSWSSSCPRRGACNRVDASTGGWYARWELTRIAVGILYDGASETRGDSVVSRICPCWPCQATYAACAALRS